MRRRELIVGGGTIAATALAGCTSQAAPTGGSAGENSTRTIAVTGTGKAIDEPDLAYFRVGIEETGSDPQAIRDEIASREADIRQALIDAGIDDEAITTDRFRVREIRRDPGRREDDEESDEGTYFEGAHALRVEVEETDRIGTILDVAIDAGADHVGGVRFTLSDERREALREEALANALENAEAEAEHIANELGVDIVSVKHVDSSGGRTPVIRHELDVADDAAHTETDIHPDDIEVSANVGLVVEFG